MHPATLLDHAAALIAAALRFEQPSDAVAAAYFGQHHTLGPRERSTLGDTLFGLLRRKPLFEHLAAGGPGAMARRLAILAFSAPRAFLLAALSAPERDWLAQCDERLAQPLPPELAHGLPAWLAAPLQERLGAEFDAFATAIREPAPLDLRVNVMAATRATACDALRAEGVEVHPTPYSPWGLRAGGKPAVSRLDAFRRGTVEVQDEGAQLLALAAQPRRGEIVVDFCAGAGGKTLALGAAMRDTGRVYAFDTSAHRLEALKPRLARSGLSNVHAMALAHENDERLARLAGKADRVLVDAPCSGVGTLRRHPDVVWRQSPRAVAEFAGRQKAILDAAARLVRPGGRLLYATCSLLPEENAAVAMEFSAHRRDFAGVPLIDILERARVPNPAHLCSADGAHMELWPHRHGTDGFFTAAWQRN